VLQNACCAKEQARTALYSWVEAFGLELPPYLAPEASDHYMRSKCINNRINAVQYRSKNVSKTVSIASDSRATDALRASEPLTSRQLSSGDQSSGQEP
jgi:hypothetical protein